MTISIANAQIRQLPNPNLITTPYEVDLKRTGGDINLTYYTLDSKGNRITVPFDVSYENPDKFGFVFTENTIKAELANGLEVFDGRIYYEIKSDETYRESANPFMLERNISDKYTVVDSNYSGLGFDYFHNYTVPQHRRVTNQLGQEEERQLNRYIDFSQIFKKEVNLYQDSTSEEFVDVCVDIDCNKTIQVWQNVTRRIARDTTFSFIQSGKDWIVEFFNLFDLDPSFIDDTDTNYALGTMLNMNTSGTGVDANLTSTGRNTSGFYASQIFDMGATSNVSNISIKTEIPYDTELGRAFAEMNTSGLVGLWHFNNESEMGENDSLFRDYSTQLNPERFGEPEVNGTCIDPNCPIYNSTAWLGHYAVTFPRKSQVGSAFINLSSLSGYDYSPPQLNSTGNVTWTIWAKPLSTTTTTQFIVTQNDGGTTANWIRLQASQSINCRMGGVTAGGTTGNFVAIDQWHFYVCRFNGTNVAGFVDAIQLSNATKTTPMTYVRAPWLIGRNSEAASTNTLSWNGSIDEFTMWNRSLSNAEIEELYRRGAIRLNVSVRTCDDASCAGETYTQLSNVTNGTPQMPMYFPLNRYVQYNITYSNNASTNYRVIVENISLNYYLASRFNFTKLINSTAKTEFNLDDGILNNTYFNESIGAIQTKKFIINGTYLSQVFDAGTVQSWKNISWLEGALYGSEIGRGGYDGLNPPTGFGATDNLSINTTGLVSLFHWNNETSENDTKFADFAGGFNGTCNGANCPTYNNSEYVFGQSITSNSVNDFINISHPVICGNCNYTIAFWYNGQSTPGSTPHMYSEGSTASSNQRFQIANTNGDSDLDVALTNDAGASVYSYQVVANVFNTSWNHIVVTANSSAMMVYINGVLDGTTAYTPSTVTLTNSCWMSLCRNSPPTLGMIGSYDEGSVWNRSLSSAEILNLYKRGLMRLNLSVRSCASSDCSDQTGFQQVHENSTKSNLTIPDNRYFQYQANFFKNASNGWYPELYNVTVHYERPVALAANSCTYTSGDWIINCADNCITSSSVDLGDNNIHSYGSGSWTIATGGIVSNYGSMFNRCNTFCHNGGLCFVS